MLEISYYSQYSNRHDIKKIVLLFELRCGIEIIQKFGLTSFSLLCSDTHWRPYLRKDMELTEGGSKKGN
jgi:hypothetical protein